MGRHAALVFVLFLSVPLLVPATARAELEVAALAGLVPAQEWSPLGRLDLAWRLAPAWHVDLLLGAAAGLSTGGIRLSAAPGVRWTPLENPFIRPHLWIGGIHAHAMNASHLAHSPVHAVVGADGYTAHRTGLGMGVGLALSPLPSLPLQVVGRLAGFAFLPQEGLPGTQAEVLVGLGWRFD